MAITKNDIIMFAAKKLPQQFTTEDLLVEAWKLDKEKFGLDGFKDQYPSNNKLLVCLMGEKGLIKRGQLRKFKDGKLSLSQ